MATGGAFNPLAVFKGMYCAFDAVLANEEPLNAIETLSRQANACFDEFVLRGAQETGAVACRGGCSSCCTIQVAATAPEVLSLARFIRSSPDAVSSVISRRIAAADQATRGLDQRQRMVSRVVCPLIENDLCLAYAVRPLACRGHASFDEAACRQALNGGACEVPVSALHLTMRSLVQNAMQAALRDAGFAWGTYELNQALCRALCDERCERSWVAGADVFAPALMTDVSLDEMAQTFDQIKAMAV